MPDILKHFGECANRRARPLESRSGFCPNCDCDRHNKTLRELGVDCEGRGWEERAAEQELREWPPARAPMGQW